MKRVRTDGDAVLSVEDFCRRNLVSRSMFFREIKAGTLTAHKFGRRVGVFPKDEARWRAARPLAVGNPNHWKLK